VFLFQDGFQCLKRVIDKIAELAEIIDSFQEVIRTA
jgi:hypothetical protein